MTETAHVQRLERRFLANYADNVPSTQRSARDVTAARRAGGASQSPISPCASAQKHAAAQVWLLLEGGGSVGRPLRRAVDGDSIDFVVWALDETHNAVLPHQIAGLTKSIYFEAKAELLEISLFNRTIEIMRGPVPCKSGATRIYPRCQCQNKIRIPVRGRSDVMENATGRSTEAVEIIDAAPMSIRRSLGSPGRGQLPSRMTRTIGSSPADEHSRLDA